MDLFKIYLSRSAGSFCGFNQTSESYKPQDGADLKIELEEAERIRKLFKLNIYSEKKKPIKFR